MRVLLDTNIVLDFILQRPDFIADSEEIFVRLQNLGFTGYVTSITIVNTFYITRKEAGIDRAWDAVSTILSLTKVAETDSNAMHTALSSGFSDYEDAVQSASAANANLDAIVTRNKKDFINSPIPVYTPFEFINFLDQKRSEN